jgi:dTDP-4-dehydrorhamnose reductase
MSFPYSKIILWGSTGMLGTYVLNYFHSLNIPVICITRKDYDLSKINFELIETLILSKLDLNNDKIAVINCSGCIPQKFSEQNRKNINDMWTVNTIFPHIMNSICLKYNFKFIHISTDCVFKGTKKYPESYNETDIHDEHSTYGNSKSLGESDKFQIIRTSIIGEEKFHKVSLLEVLRNQSTSKFKSIYGFENHYWNGLTCLTLSKIIFQILNENIFWTGPRHIYSESKNKYEILKIINEVYDLKVNIIPIKPKDAVNRLLSSIYPIDIFNIPSIRNQIIEMEHFKI